MPDWGILSLPILGATGVLLLAFITADDIAIDRIVVPTSLHWYGYTDTVVTETLRDHLRDINDTALQFELGIDVQTNRFDASVSQFEHFFGLTELVTGMRELTGGILYFVNGDITQQQGKLVFTARVFIEDARRSVHVVQVEGSLLDVDAMLKEGALRILEHIDPYIVALHYHEQELINGDYKFEKTRATLRTFVLTPPPDNNYLAFDLIGRIHLERAKCDPLLSEEDRAAEVETALSWLLFAIDGRPDYFYTNLHLAEAYLALGNHRLADQYFARAVRIDPDNWPTRARWGEALAEQGRTRDAIFQYVAAVELHPGSAELRHALSNLYLAADHTEQSRLQLEQALLIDPHAVNGSMHFDAGHAPMPCEL